MFQNLNDPYEEFEKQVKSAAGAQFQREFHVEKKL